MKKYDVIIIGAGPAGLMTSCTITGKSVLLIDANPEIGGKIKVSGGGRCNITNNKSIDNFLQNVPKNEKFLYSTFNNLSPQDIIEFFTKQGIELKEEDHNRMFPINDSSQTFIDFFKNKLSSAKNVTIQTNYLVTSISQNQDNNFIVNEEFQSKYLICAAGGATYPHLSQGDGIHQILHRLGHKITPLLPSESPLISQDELITNKTLQGITLLDCKLDLYIDGKKKKSFTGDNLLFTHFGLSGPLALRSSYYIKEALSRGKTCFVSISPNPAKTPNKVKSFLDENHSLKINIIDIKGFNTAFTTNGGVSLKEVNSQSFESKLINNLFLIGELLDIHAFTGGYNIAISLSEGFSTADYINQLP